MQAMGFDPAALGENAAVLWTSAMRELQARKRLTLQEDISAGVMPKAFKDYKCWLAGLAYPDDEDRYRQEVYNIIDIPAGPSE